MSTGGYATVRLDRFTELHKFVACLVGTWQVSYDQSQCPSWCLWIETFELPLPADICHHRQQMPHAPAMSLGNPCRKLSMRAASNVTCFPWPCLGTYECFRPVAASHWSNKNARSLPALLLHQLHVLALEGALKGSYLRET